MKTKPTWTRYGNGVIMMGNYPSPKKNPAESKDQQGSPQPPDKSLDPPKR